MSGSNQRDTLVYFCIGKINVFVQFSRNITETIPYVFVLTFNRRFRIDLLEFFFFSKAEQ